MIVKFEFNSLDLVTDCNVIDRKFGHTVTYILRGRVRALLVNVLPECVFVCECMHVGNRGISGESIKD
jgi:hypothetical protein